MEASKAVASRLIGAIIVEKNLVTAEQLERALELQEQTGERLGEIVVAEFGVSRLELAGVLTEQWSALQKLWPPTPAPDPQPWHNRVPDMKSAPLEFAAEVPAIEGHLRVVERAAAPTPWQSELDAVRTMLEELGLLSSAAEALAALQEQVHRLKTFPDRVGELADLGVEIETLTARLDDVTGVAEPGSRQAEADPGDQRADIALVVARIDRYGAPVEDVASIPIHDPILRSGELESRIEAVKQSVPAKPTELLARLDRLEEKGRSEDDDLARLTTELDAMRLLTERRFEELAGREPDLTPVEELRVRFDRLVARKPDQAGLDGLRARVDELAASAPRSDETSSLEARLGELEERVFSAAPLAELREEIRRVSESTVIERASLEQTLLARVEELTAAVPREDELTDVRRRLDEIAAQPVVAAELNSRVDALMDRIEGLATVEAAISALRVTVEESDGARVGTALATGARLAGIDAALETVAGLEARVSEWMERDQAEQARVLRAELDERLKGLTALRAEDADAARSAAAELEARLERLAGTLHGEAAEARAVAEGVVSRVDELHGLRAEDREAAELAAGELAARLDDHTLRSASAALIVEKSVREELGGAAARLEEQDAQGIEAREQLRGELERVGSSIGWRLERIEEALAADDTTSLRDAVGELERRLEGQAAIGEEQVRVTERALRKGLASLGERLAESESVYLEAGSTLRRSIERLGAAVVEADARMAAQILVSDTEGYVAFAPTPSGYRLVGIPATAPELGATVELEECEGPLVVTRYGRSPLPLDSRPCAYLDHA